MASGPHPKFAWVGGILGPLTTLFGVTLLSYNAVSPSTASPQRYALAVLCMLAIAVFNFLIGAFALRARPPGA